MALQVQIVFLLNWTVRPCGVLKTAIEFNENSTMSKLMVPAVCPSFFPPNIIFLSLLSASFFARHANLRVKGIETFSFYCNDHFSPFFLQIACSSHWVF